MFKAYSDLMADVRYDNRLHSIRSLVQPGDPTVKKVADILVNAPDFVAAAQDFVNSFTRYAHEPGDYWSIPDEALSHELTRFRSDCDCKSILLCSILRNYIDPENVFCVVGKHLDSTGEYGHMWVVTQNPDGSDRLVEATAPSSHRLSGRYKTYALFNDQYCLASLEGIEEFGLFPLEFLRPELITV